MRVTGLDLSLTGTGIALAEPHQIRTRTVGSKADDGTIEGRSRRLRGLVQVVWPFVQAVDLVVIEAPAYSSNSGKAHDRSGYWWMLVGRLTGAGIPVAVVQGNTLKVYATGKGRADKDQVLAAVVRRYLDVDVQDNNQADALVLACMGLRAAGAPYDEPLPQTHVRAMAAVAWPPNLKGADA